ncbi:MAG: VOC family protein [Ardenticatenales bacterium]
MIRDLDMVLLFTTDVDRAVAWYTDILGLKLRARHGDFAVFETGGTPLALHGGADASASASPSTGATPVLRVDDYAAAKAALEAKGCVFTFENSTPHAMFGSFSDPDGNALQIIERRGG